MLVLKLWECRIWRDISNKFDNISRAYSAVHYSMLLGKEIVENRKKIFSMCTQRLYYIQRTCTNSGEKVFTVKTAALISFYPCAILKIWPIALRTLLITTISRIFSLIDLGGADRNAESKPLVTAIICKLPFSRVHASVHNGVKVTLYILIF